MNELIPTFTGQLAGETQPLLNARDLHVFLQSKQEFATWIKNRIEKYRFTEAEDFLINLSKSTFGRSKSEYHISLRMAEHIGMVDDTDRGFQIREYFRQMEKLARRDVPTYLRKGKFDTDTGWQSDNQLAAMRQVMIEVQPLWAKVRRYYQAGLTQKEMQRLLDIGDTKLRETLRHMALCGLVDYAPSAASVAGGKAAMAKRLAVSHVH